MSRAERYRLFPEHKKARDLNVGRLRKAIKLLTLAINSGHIIDSHLHYPDITPTDFIRVARQNILKAIEIEEL